MVQTSNSFDSTIDHNGYNPILAYIGSDAASSSSTPLTSNTKSYDESQSFSLNTQFDFKRNVSTPSHQCTKEHMYRAFLARRECIDNNSLPSTSSNANSSSMNLCDVEVDDQVFSQQETYGNESCRLRPMKNCIGEENIERISMVPHERNDSVTDDEIICNNENFMNMVDRIFRLEAKIEYIEKNLFEDSDHKRSLSDESLKLVTCELDERGKGEDEKDDSIYSTRSYQLGKDLLTNLITSEETSKPTICKNPFKEKVKKTRKQTTKKKVLKVRSTCNLVEGQVFSILVDREPFIISVPSGGVRKGEMMKVCLRTQHVIKSEEGNGIFKKNE